MVSLHFIVNLQRLRLERIHDHRVTIHYGNSLSHLTGSSLGVVCNL